MSRACIFPTRITLSDARNVRTFCTPLYLVASPQTAMADWASRLKLGGFLLAFSARISHCFQPQIPLTGVRSRFVSQCSVSDRTNFGFYCPTNVIGRSPAAKETLKCRNVGRLFMSNAGSKRSLILPKPLRGVLFDMDGTLSDSESLHWRAYERVFARSVPDFPHNPITREFYNAKMGGRTKANAVEGVLPHLGHEQRRQLCSDLEKEFEVLAKTDLVCLPGVLKVLDWLEGASVPAAIVTNAPATEMAFSLSRLGVAGRFVTKVTSEECSHPKPHPAPYLEGMRRLGVTVEEAVAFEDSLAGVRSAVAAGLLTVGIMTSRTAEELHAAGAALAVPDMADPRLWGALAAWRAGAAPAPSFPR